MFLPKSVYVDFILATEKPKRLEGILQEQFFERSLVPKMEDGTTFSFGWVRTWCKKSKRRVWCHIIDRDNPPKDSVTSARFTEFLANNCGEPLVKIKAGLKAESNKLVGLDIDVLEYKDNRWQPSMEYEALVEGCLHDKGWLSRWSVNHKIPQENRPFRDHFEALTAAELNRLLVTRVLLNNGIGYPVDIDAVFLRNGAFGVVEYKRKDPMQGHFAFVEQPPDMENFLTNLKKDFINFLSTNDAMERESRINYETVRKYFWMFIQRDHRGRLISQYEKESCFGLDVSHFRMAEFCKKLGMHYRYLIWNHARPGEGESLLSEELLPVLEDEQLLFLTNKSRYLVVDGLNLTIGNDSGSFTGNVSSAQAKERRLDLYDSIRLQVTYRNCECQFRNVDRFGRFGNCG